MIWLARHGETTWNVAGRYQGRLESTLTPLGERQAAALATFFAARAARGESIPERVYSSPLRRCTETARPSAEALGVPVETDDRLIEIGHGTWEGRYREDIAREDPERYGLWQREPARVAFDGGETLAEVLVRWRAFASDLATRTQPALVTTHDAVLRCALLALLGRPLEEFWKMRVENGAFALIESDGQKLALLRDCETSHLDGSRAQVTGQAL